MTVLVGCVAKMQFRRQPHSLLPSGVHLFSNTAFKVEPGQHPGFHGLFWAVDFEIYKKLFMSPPALTSPLSTASATFWSWVFISNLCNDILNPLYPKIDDFQA